MNLKSILKKVVLTIGVVIPLFGHAQLKKNIEYSGFFDTYYFRGPTLFSLGTGINYYNGDLCGGIKCNSFNYNVSLGVGYQVWPGVVFGGEVSYMKLGATDSNIDRNITFSSPNYEVMGFGRYHLRRDIVRRHSDMLKRPKIFKPYIMLGAAGLVYNPTATYPDATGEIINVDEGKSYPGVTFAIPSGLGASFVISHRVQIMSEFVFRYTFSDYLDGVGENFGNSKITDAIYSFHIKIAYAPKAPRLKKKKRKYSPPSDDEQTEGSSSDGGGSGGSSAPKKVAPSQSKPVNNDSSSEEEEYDELPEKYDLPDEGIEDVEDIPTDDESIEEDGFEEDEDSFEDWK